jgi:glucose/arabinose dehydrogenase
MHGRFLISLLIGALAWPAAAARAATYSGGFHEETVVPNLSRPTAIDWTPDGRMLIAEQEGRLQVLEPGASSPSTVIDLSDRVNSHGTRGLLGLAVDSHFASNGYAYLLYTYELDPANPETSSPMVAQLLRIRLDPSNAVLEQKVLLGSYVSGPCPTADNSVDCIPAEGDSHTIGTVRSARDGTLWLGSGDGAGYTSVDQLAFRSYDEASLAGKIMHVDREGHGLAGHPFCPSDGDLAHVCTKLFAKGFRNPFRFTLLPAGGLLVADVGWNTLEEIDLLSAGGRNYGWPCYEGTQHASGSPSGYDDDPKCPPEYLKEGSPQADTPPNYEYEHTPGGNSIVGGPQYEGRTYPTTYRGKLFFGDFNAGFLKTLSPGPNGQLAATAFAEDWHGVDLEQAPDGNLVYLDYGTGAAGTGAVKEIESPPNRSPVAVAGADTRSGQAPLTVHLDGSRSSDPDGDSLTYRWDFGDGSPPAGRRSPAHAYAPGRYTATLTVRDGRGGQGSSSVRIAAAAPATPAGPKAAGPLLLFQARQGLRARHGILTGTARDTVDLTRVAVALGIRAGAAHGCRWWVRARRRLARSARPCDRPRYMRALLRRIRPGLWRWRIRLGSRLPARSYRLRIRALDSARRTSRLRIKLRVRRR